MNISDFGMLSGPTGWPGTYMSIRHMFHIRISSGFPVSPILRSHSRRTITVQLNIKIDRESDKGVGMKHHEEVSGVMPDGVPSPMIADREPSVNNKLIDICERTLLWNRQRNSTVERRVSFCSPLPHCWIWNPSAKNLNACSSGQSAPIVSLTWAKKITTGTWARSMHH